MYYTWEASNQKYLLDWPCKELRCNEANRLMLQTIWSFTRIDHILSLCTEEESWVQFFNQHTSSVAQINLKLVHNYYNLKLILISILFYSLWRLVPPENVPRGMVMAEEAPPLPIQTLFSCFFKPSPFTLYSFTQSFHLTTGLPLFLEPSISLKYMFAFHKLLTFSLSIWSNHLKVFRFTYGTTPHVIKFSTSCHAPSFIHAFIALTLPPCHSFSQHTFLTAVINFMSNSLIHTSMLAGE